MGAPSPEGRQGEGPCTQAGGTGRWAGPQREPRALAGRAEAGLGLAGARRGEEGPGPLGTHMALAQLSPHLLSGQSWPVGWGTAVHGGSTWAAEAESHGGVWQGLRAQDVRAKSTHRLQGPGGWRRVALVTAGDPEATLGRSLGRGARPGF